MIAGPTFSELVVYAGEKISQKIGYTLSSGERRLEESRKVSAEARAVRFEEIRLRYNFYPEGTPRGY